MLPSGEECSLQHLIQHLELLNLMSKEHININLRAQFFRQSYSILNSSKLENVCITRRIIICQYESMQYL